MALEAMGSERVSVTFSVRMGDRMHLPGKYCRVLMKNTAFIRKLIKKLFLGIFQTIHRCCINKIYTSTHIYQ
jgi:hypothetical protein